MGTDDLRSTDAAQLGVLYNELTRIGYSDSGMTEHDDDLTDVVSEVDLRLMEPGLTLATLDGLIDGTETVEDRERLGIAILEMVVRDRRDLWPAFDSRCRHDNRWNKAFGAAWVPKDIASQMPLGLRATVMHID